MEDTPRPPRGRGRARTRARSPTRPNSERSSPPMSRSPERAFSTVSSGTSVAQMSRGIDTLTMRSSSSGGHTARSTTGDNSAADTSRGAKRGIRTDADYFVSRPEGKDKIGKKGTVIPMKANYYEVRTLPGWALYEYRVDFEPKHDRVFVLKKLFKQAVANRMGYIFDGSVAYTPKLFGENADQPGDHVDLNVEPVDKDGTPYKINVKLVSKLDPGSPAYMAIYNLLLRKCMYAVGLEMLGRNFFDPLAAIEIPSQRLTLWPGYLTSIRQHEKKMLLCVETTHKVLRLDSVLMIIKGLERAMGSNTVAFKEAVRKELVHTIVLTSYNRKTYHVDEVDFERSPKSMFEIKGKMQPLAEYYKERYDKHIKDLNQCLLIAKPSAKDMHRGLTGEIVLVPEFCQSTGLTDTMRANFSLMKELGKYLHQGPQEKSLLLDNFLKRMRENQTIKEELGSWGMEFDGKLIELQGRILGKEAIMFAKGTQMVDDKGDFTMAFRSQQMLSAVNLSSWAIVVPQRDFGGVDNLVRTMSKVAGPLSMKIDNPKQILKVPDGRTMTYLKAMDELLERHNLQMLFIILPNNKAELYSAVKKRLAVDLGVLSQCFLAKNVTSKGLMSIATKVVVQMNAKLGGEPWTLKLPLKNTMFVGFDVYHGAKGSSGGSVGAMVATYSGNFTRYYSTTSHFKRGDDGKELCATMLVDIIKCCHKYHELNAEVGLPERIIMYRDGVGEGQLKQVFEVELKTLSEGLAKLYQDVGRGPPNLTYIVVTKRINTKLMMMKMNLQNPPPGTVVDDVVTLPERHDFYLISCTARQGTVSPCSYNVLRDDSNFDADKLQLITYKLCHMYFNWSGTIAVPAPCQYAHKLAFLTGMNYGGHANANLNNLLHFL